MGENPAAEEGVGGEDGLKADGHLTSELRIVGEVGRVRVGVGNDELVLVDLGRVTRRVPCCGIGEGTRLEDGDVAKEVALYVQEGKVQPRALDD